MSELTLQDAVNARIQARNSEVKTDSQEQTELTTEEVETEEVETEIPEENDGSTDNSEEEVEESVESEDDTNDAVDEDKELEYFQIGDIEATLEEIKEWKNGSLRKADYTKKTQEVAEARKAVEALTAETTKVKEDLINKAAMLEVLIDESSLTEEEMLELREYDPAEYLEKKELQEKRKQALEKVKESLLNTKHSEAYIQQEQAKVFANNKEWTDANGKVTEKCTQDLAKVKEYVEKLGMTEEEKSSIVSSKHWQILIDAAINTSKIDKKEVLKKKVVKAPTVTKKSTATSVHSNKELANAQKAAKENPTMDNLVKLRQIERKYKK